MKANFLDSPGRAFALMALAVVTCASLAKGQAAAEYSLGLSNVGGGMASFGNTLGQAMSGSMGKLSTDLKDEMRMSPAQAMKENRLALEKEAKEGGGTLHFASEPSDAAVFIDGRLVAKTPAVVKVPEGKHSIKISRPDREGWTKQIAVNKGQDLGLNAKLINPNPSAITISFADSKN